MCSSLSFVASRAAAVLVACLLTVVASRCNAQWSLYSEVFSLGFKEQLLKDEALRDSLEVSPSQVEALKQSLDGERCRKELREISNSYFLGKGEFSKQPESVYQHQIDLYIEKELRKVLTTEQMDRRRITHVRRVYPRPLAALSVYGLNIVNIPRDEQQKVFAAIAPLEKSVGAAADELRAKKLATITKDFTKLQKQLFFQFYGVKYRPEDLEALPVDLATIQFFPYAMESAQATWLYTNNVASKIRLNASEQEFIKNSSSRYARYAFAEVGQAFSQPVGRGARPYRG